MRPSAMLLCLVLALLPAYAAAGGLTYPVEPASTHIRFVVSHFGLFTTKGEFQRFSGQLYLDPDHPETARVAVTVETASVDTFWGDRNALLRSPDYFDVTRFPTMTFTSTTVERTGPTTARVHGVLTLLGRSHDETFDAALIDRKTDATGEVASFNVTGRVLRSDFGMTQGKPMVADEVDIAIDAHVRLR